MSDRLKQFAAAALAKPAEVLVQEAVEKHGSFAFELKVGQSMSVEPSAQAVAEIKVEHGGVFSDGGQRGRFGYRCALSNGGGQRRLFLAVECRNLSPSSPLVVCGIKRPDNEAFDNLARSRAKGGPGHGGRIADVMTRPGAVSFYPPGVFVGKSLLRVDLEKNPPAAVEELEIADTWARAARSAAGMLERACRVDGPVAPQFVYSAILPIVVVPDGSLWLASHASDGAIASPPVQAAACEFFVGIEVDSGGLTSKNFGLSHVHFFTLGGFGAFFRKLATDAQAWTLLFRY